MKITRLLLIFLFVTIGCSKEKHTKNINHLKLHPTKTLEVSSTIKFLLDTLTAPRPQYIQLHEDKSGNQYLTLLNKFTNSIYLYDYKSYNYIKQVKMNDKGPDGILKPYGYYIKSLDSIYIYNAMLPELLLINGSGRILNKISLTDNERKKWFERLPQYVPESASPIVESNGKIYLTGQSMLNLAPNRIANFKFTASIDLGLHKVDFMHTYPQELYGGGTNWYGDMFMKVNVALHPKGEKLIYSFPVSHDLYLMDIKGGRSEKRYAGSNQASDIVSFNNDMENTSVQDVFRHYALQDQYGNIIYDKYRKAYYRFIKRSIPNAKGTNRPSDKLIGIIIMNENFDYLGEFTLGNGKEWYSQNSFVTKEGLNVEYADPQDIAEQNITLKIFTIKDLKKQQ